MTDVHLKRHELFIHNLGITWDALISLCRLPKLTSRYNQVLGPSISPVGFDKARKIENWMIQTERSAKVAICGTRYANRIELANKFKAKGLPFLLIGGEYGSKRLTDEEYWRKQMSCSIQVCLLDSYTGIGFHLKGHFSESLIAGCLTIVNNREIIPQEFREGIHYLYSPTLEGITSLVDDILSGRSEVDINAIALQGRKRYLELAHSSNYWNHILTNNLP
jgi:hypothetical protein